MLLSEQILKMFLPAEDEVCIEHLSHYRQQNQMKRKININCVKSDLEQQSGTMASYL